MEAWNVTRKSLRFICRSWRPIGEKYFFQSMACSSPKDDDWEDLANLLERRVDGSFGAGRYVQRLALRAINDTPKKIEQMQRIIKNCPNVICLYASVREVFSNLQRYGKDLVTTCFTASATRLQRLDLDLGLSFDESLAVSLLKKCPNLRILNVGTSFGEDEEGFVIERTILSKLHSLSLTSSNEDWLSIFDSNDWIFDNLRHLSLFRMASPDTVLSFFQRYGAQLKSLRFDIPNLEVDTIIQKCTLLQDVIISLRIYSHASTTHSFRHKTVNRIGICHVEDLFTSLLTIEEVWPTLEEMADWFTTKWKLPCLTTVRLIGIDARKFVKLLMDDDQKEMWSEFIFRLEEAEIYLEDEEGKRLSASTRQRLR